MGFLGFENGDSFMLFVTSVMAGMAILLGMSAVTATPPFLFQYYKYIRDDPNASATYPKFWADVLTYYTVVTEIAQAVLQPLNLIPFFRRFSYIFRLEFGSVIALGEVLLPLVMPHTGISEFGAVVGILMAAFIGGLARAIFENTVFALFGTCPPKNIVGAMLGLPASASIMSIVQIVLLLTMGTDFHSILKQSVIYFSIGIAIISTSAILLLFLYCNSFAKNFIPELRSTRSPWRDIYCVLRTTDDLAKPNQACNSAERGNDLTRSKTENWQVASPNLEAEGNVVIEPKGESEISPQDNDNVDPEGLISTELLQRVKLWHVIKAIYPMQFVCFLSFYITMFVFPGVFLSVDRGDTWYTTLVVAIFNFSDFAARTLLIWEKTRISRRNLVIMSFLRLLLIPVPILCGIGTIKSKAVAYIISSIFGLTGGYAGTLSMEYAPTSPGLKGNGEQAMASQACDMMLALGCSLGILSQTALIKTGCL